MPDTRFPITPLQPGSYSTVDASALIASEQVAGRPVVAVIGATTGGLDNTALHFRSPQALKSILRSGAALDTARLAMAGGASEVIVVRAGAGILPGSSAL